MRFSLCILLAIFTIPFYAQDTLTKVAFLADVHLQDLYGSFTDTDYKGISLNGEPPVLMRTMEAQLHSTRIFNENYFAFIAALNDIAKKGIKYVALPGDYTDDGQPIHLRGLRRVLEEYSSNYGVSFFITTGNHDPVGPFAKEAGKDDFLGNGGKAQPIFSKSGIYNPKPDDLPTIITKDIATMGYTGIIEQLGNFGFLPQSSYLYWATPFSNYSYNNYNYKTALAQSGFDRRQYEVAPGFTVPDASYVTEPVKGLWLLAIDGNTYLPKNPQGNYNDPKKYHVSDLGYNNVLNNKTHLIGWVKNVAAEAKRLNKILIAFSHYPMIEFNDGASPKIEAFMGKGKWQLNRIPVEAVAQTFANAGITLHFGGHMHINDTGITTTQQGNTLLNVQTPSLAAYIPAYKILTLHPSGTAEIETITIDSVPGFDALFKHYETEYAYLQSIGKKDIWNKAILNTKSYRKFTDFHLRELVRLRFIPADWDAEFAAFLYGLSGKDLLVLAHTSDNKEYNKLLNNKKLYNREWKKVLNKIKQEPDVVGLDIDNITEIKGEDLINDFYRIRSADELAVTDIGEQRIKQYRYLAQCFLKAANNGTENSHHQDLVLFFTILNKFLNGAPANHFMYNLQTGALENLKK